MGLVVNIPTSTHSMCINKGDQYLKDRYRERSADILTPRRSAGLPRPRTVLFVAHLVPPMVPMGPPMGPQGSLDPFIETTPHFEPLTHYASNDLAYTCFWKLKLFLERVTS